MLIVRDVQTGGTPLFLFQPERGGSGEIHAQKIIALEDRYKTLGNSNQIHRRHMPEKIDTHVLRFIQCIEFLETIELHSR